MSHDKLTLHMNNLRDTKFDEWFSDEKSKRSDEDVRDCVWHDYDESEFEAEMEEKVHDLEPEDAESFKKEYYEKEFESKARDHYNEMYDEFIERIYDHLEFVDENHFKVYRKMTVAQGLYPKFIEGLSNNQFLDKHKGIGIYWAYDANKAEAHAGKYNGEPYFLVKLTAIAPFTAINFEDTFMLNMDMSCGESEAELRLQCDYYINIIEIDNENETLSVDYLVHTDSY